jgi:hypothetical protein
MNEKTARVEWVTIGIIAPMIVLSMMGRLAEAAAPTCPCWDIEEVELKAPASEFPCTTKEKQVHPEAQLTVAAAQSLNNVQNFHLEATLIKIKKKSDAQERHQAWCKCFSNPSITGCIEGELKDLDRPEGQACINEIARLCRNIRKN